MVKHGNAFFLKNVKYRSCGSVATQAEATPLLTVTSHHINLCYASLFKLVIACEGNPPALLHCNDIYYCKRARLRLSSLLLFEVKRPLTVA